MRYEWAPASASRLWAAMMRTFPSKMARRRSFSDCEEYTVPKSSVQVSKESSSGSASREGAGFEDEKVAARQVGCSVVAAGVVESKARIMGAGVGWLGRAARSPLMDVNTR